MPRNGQGVYSLPPNTAAVAGQTIESAPYNTVNNDIANDLNAARPITAGGTGATNAEDALTNLGGVGQDNFLSAFPIGDFYETVRNIATENGVWLRRNGALYDSADYPVLAALLPSLPDGVEWSNISGIPNVKSVVINDDGFFAAAAATGDITQIWKSTDGTTFSLISSIANVVSSSFTFVNGVYLVTGIGSDTIGKVVASSDALTWGSPVSPGVGNTVFAATYNGSLYVAVGNGGLIASSPDLVTWTARTSGTSQSLRSVEYINNTIVVTGFSGVVTTSPDGITYTLRTTGTSENLLSSTYSSSASLYVVVGSTGTILTSPNLSSWTARTSGTTQDLNDVISSSSGLLAVGNSGVARISSNATSWTSTTTGVTAALVSTAFNPDAPQEYYAAGAGSLIKGVRTLPTQFRVPSDDPTYGWIKADNE